MNLRKILTYVLLSAGLLLAYRLYDIAKHRTDEPEAEAPALQVELAAPNFPVTYSLGSFDTRFGISQERFLILAAEAKKIWEDAAGKSLFEPADNGGMKINLIYDWRQENLLKAQSARAVLDEKGRSFDQLQADYNSRAGSLDDYRRNFEEGAQNFKTHMEEYNTRVARWNEGTERPDAEFSALQSRKRELEDEQDAVEKKRIDLNARGEELNKLGDALNELARKHNLEVEKFNGTYISSRDFEKGLFDGKAINIYEFEKEGDLKVALVHEFGHAIGLGHLDNPNAIMSRKLAQQDFNDIRLSEDDVKLLKSKVN